MKDVKNLVIVVLSVIVLIQSVFLLRFLGRQRAGAAREVPAGLEERPVVSPKPAPQPPVPHVKETPAKVSGRIALVLDDWGNSLRNKDFITDNAFNVTLAVLPFKAYSSDVAALAHQKNKEVIIHMPMEPNHKEQYGLEEKTLLTAMDKKTILNVLDEAFVSVPFAQGMNNHMGSKATQDKRLMSIVLQYLNYRKLFFLDSFVTPESVCAGLARKLGVAFGRRDIFIDNENSPEYIRAQVMKLAQKAKDSGVAIGIGHDRPATVAVLKEMIPRLEADGYRFISLSEALRLERGE